MNLFQGRIAPAYTTKSLTNDRIATPATARDQAAPETAFHLFGKRRLRACVWNGHHLQSHKKAAGDRDAVNSPMPLLIFNGIGLNLEVLGPLAAELSDRAVLSIDMPGIGRSPPSKVPYTPKKAAEWGAKLLDHHGIKRADVLGSSWGGAAAQHFASDHTDRLGRLVLAAIGPSLPIVPGSATFSLNLMDPIWRGEMAGSDLLNRVSAVDQRAIISEVQSLFIPPTKRGYTLQAMALLAWNSAFSMPFVNCETLILAGAQDHVVPLANQHLLQMFLQRSQLDVIDDAGHLFLFSHKNEVAQRLRDFLGSGTV